MRRAGELLVVSAVVTMLTPHAGIAQETGASGQAADSVSLVFEREVFHYPAFDRRNPFEPLTGDQGSPRYEDLRLLGVILSPDPARSVALLGVDAGAGPGGTAPRSYRLRAGEGIGNVRILEIERMRVLVEVAEFGLTERRVMELRLVNDPAPQEIFRPREPTGSPADTAGGAPSSAQGGEPPGGFHHEVEGGAQ